MVVDPERPPQELGRQKMVPDVRRAAAEVVGYVALADLREVVEQVLARYDDLDRLACAVLSIWVRWYVPSGAVLLSLKP